MKNDPRGLADGRRQQPYEHQQATSLEQENYGAGGDYRGDLGFGGFSDQDYGSQGYSGQGYGDRSYGDPDYGGQTFARRGSQDFGGDGFDDDGPGLGATAYERHSDFGIREYRGDRDVPGSGGADYGDVGTARGLGQTYGGHNYDGRGQRQEPDPGMLASSKRGLGPKGYRRSDARVLEDVNERLHDDEQVDASDIEVECSGGVVTLTGHVDDRVARRHVENVVAATRGVVDVVNRLAIGPRDGDGAAARER